jgi:hypothetical protein
MILAILMVLGAGIYRLVPHPWNVAPITAMALCGGMYLGRRYALIVPLAAMFLSDLVIGFTSVTPFVYACFIVAGLMGLWLRNHKQLGWLAGATLANSILFYIVTNLAHWAFTSMYPKTVAGLWQCYVAALPFFGGTFAGDALFVAGFVAVVELAARPAKHAVPA